MTQPQAGSTVSGSWKSVTAAAGSSDAGINKPVLSGSRAGRGSAAHGTILLGHQMGPDGSVPIKAGAEQGLAEACEAKTQNQPTA